MDMDETRMLFKLLHQFYPKEEITEHRILAYALGLEPFAYSDVRAAAIAHARECRYFPYLSELCGKLPKRASELEQGAVNLLMHGSLTPLEAEVIAGIVNED